MTRSAGFVAGRPPRRDDAYALLYRSVFDSTRVWPVVVGPLVCFVVALGFALPAVPFAAVVLLPTPLLLALLVFRGRRLWPAQECLAWLNMIGSDAWRSEVGERMPGSAAQAKAWLQRHPEGSAADSFRAGAMLAAGWPVDAREALNRLPTGSARERHRRFDLEMALDAKEGRPLDVAAADAALREDAEMPGVEKGLHLAYHAALLAADRGGDCVRPLVAARASAGPMPRAFARRIRLVRYRGVIAALVIGAWLLAAVLVGAATAGGVVWF